MSLSKLLEPSTAKKFLVFSLPKLAHSVFGSTLCEGKVAMNAERHDLFPLSVSLYVPGPRFWYNLDVFHGDTLQVLLDVGEADRPRPKHVDVIYQQLLQAGTRVLQK